MDQEASNVNGMKEASSETESLDEETRLKPIA